MKIKYYNFQMPSYLKQSTTIILLNRNKTKNLDNQINKSAKTIKIKQISMMEKFKQKRRSND